MGANSHVFRCIVVLSLLNVAGLVNSILAIERLERLETKVTTLMQRNYKIIKKIDALQIESAVVTVHTELPDTIGDIETPGGDGE